jgi:HPt (histidine-containing phosphotransfer) domain-containing protein
MQLEFTQKDGLCVSRTEQPPADDPQFIDRKVASELAATVGTEIHRQLVRQFIEEADVEFKRITDGVCSGEVAGDVVHKIAGSAAVFGAMPLRTLLSSAEAAMKAGNIAQSDDLMESIHACWAQTKSDLETIASSET